MRKIIAGLMVLLVALGALTMAFWAFDVYEDRQHSLTIDSPTPVFIGSGSGYCDRGRLLETVHPQAKLQVKRIRYWKNCATVEVALPDGHEGYVVLGDGQQSISPKLNHE
jgi:hypothetical protein